MMAPLRSLGSAIIQMLNQQNTAAKCDDKNDLLPLFRLSSGGSSTSATCLVRIARIKKVFKLEKRLVVAVYRRMTKKLADIDGILKNIH